MVNQTISMNDEFNALAIAYARAANMANPMEGAIQKLNLAKSIARDAEAIGAEMVVARYLGIKDFEPTLNTFKNSPDVEAGQYRVEVKHTSWRDGHLIVKPSDRDIDIAVLVVGESPTYTIIGWIPVAIAKSPRFKSDQSNSWWVSQINLRPMESMIVGVEWSR
ncbi:hypothetical protein UFOVP1662_11 [uncultured Caudovirales phage]|uniref:Uncharacterized protein n=1 Tax=uncultured Caudovirales phage TaxID=2100421 RepID=A0A6J5PFK8_9CAUD|nr:hypothetical protein UFOVP883_12 [uncultured Caudovirales phage]CAB4180216.1 hypothetical protein UFOVP1050_16 [uncultured Caudovirales phage]CAB4180881.1 hypothetical protein UFOVP1059_4 [uncultured Caudovirales phage]CAB4195035.1 hypothetical protein UFOVP1274_22 [uncultured Caudovirales phage]CAB4222923.1 hypothetical protein UFOVP1662_11 [uncultured Caudovirales phage]